MKYIKSRGLKIGKEKFQLIGPNGEESKELNIKQNSKKMLSSKTENAIKNGIVKNWNRQNHGSERVKKYPVHQKFIEFMQKKKDPKILIVGLAQGFEIKNIKENVKNAKINTMDVADEILPKYKKLIEYNGMFIGNGIENFQKKSLIGKFDGITAIFSAGFHIKRSNFIKNILKMAMMLKPKGVAIIRIKRAFVPMASNQLILLFKKLKLNTHFDIKTIESDIKNQPDIIITRK